MGWMLQAENSGERSDRSLSTQDVVHVVRINKMLTIVTELMALQTELGRITVTASGAKLEAVQCGLNVLPGHTAAPSAVRDPRTASYELQPLANDRSEAIFLRHGDVVSAHDARGSITCKWSESEPEVQVNSSAVAATNGVDVMDGVADTPEDETEDEDLDNLDKAITAVEATQSKSEPEATPQLSNQRSVVVQETPTAARTNRVSDHTMSIDIGQPAFGISALTPEPEPEPEPYSTACARPSLTAGVQDDDTEAGAPALADALKGGAEPMLKDTRCHPKVMVTKKRPSPPRDDQESDVKPPSRTRKRVKTAPSENDTQDRRLSTIAVELNTSPAPEVTTKGRKRKSMVANVEDVDQQETPTRSQRSQRSTSGATSEPYQGDTPCVAVSNSAIKETGQAAKFLRKQGGTLVESVKGSFNVLCVRDGDLHKTPKVLQAIAAGTPIVTDKWLTDSAKAGQFLSVDAYAPSVPANEKEWGFKLQDVLGRPQTPFEGYTLHFTTALHSFYKSFTEIEQVCKAAGAKVTKKKMGKNNDKVIVLAMEGDKEAEKLMEDGVTCYNRDLFPLSIFRGTVDLDSDEFKLVEVTKKDAKKTKGKKS